MTQACQCTSVFVPLMSRAGSSLGVRLSFPVPQDFLQIAGSGRAPTMSWCRWQVNFASAETRTLLFCVLVWFLFVIFLEWQVKIQLLLQQNAGEVKKKSTLTITLGSKGPEAIRKPGRKQKLKKLSSLHTDEVYLHVDCFRGRALYIRFKGH